MLRADEQVLVDNLLRTKAFRRLEDVSFLGAIDYFNAKHGTHRSTTSSRADHTLGVLNLAVSVAEVAGLSGNERKLLFSAAVVHDMGHPPLSHSLEYAFPKLRRQWSHHAMLKYLIAGGSELGDEVLTCFRGSHVDAGEAAYITQPDSVHYLSYFFTSPINIDTIEGISRFITSQGYKLPYDTDALVSFTSSIFTGVEVLNELWIEQADLFWKAKASFYGQFMRYGSFAKFERQMQSSILSQMPKLEKFIYFYTDKQLFSCFPLLASPEFSNSNVAQAANLFDEFEIDTDIVELNIRNVCERYKRYGHRRSKEYA